MSSNLGNPIFASKKDFVNPNDYLRYIANVKKIRIVTQPQKYSDYKERIKNES